MMINTFIDSELSTYNKLFLKSFLSNGFSVCIWTYETDSLKKQVPFGVKIKNANEIVPYFVYKKIKDISIYFLNYFKFSFLYDVGGCFSDPTIIPIKNNLINLLNRSDDLIFGDDRYCNFLLINKLYPELDSNLIKVCKSKKEFIRDMFFSIERLLEKYDNKYFDYSYKILFEKSMILSGKPFHRELYYHAGQNKFPIFSNRHISVQCRNDILSSTYNVNENLKLIGNVFNYIDMKFIDFNKINNIDCPINRIKEDIELNGF